MRNKGPAITTSPQTSGRGFGDARCRLFGQMTCNLHRAITPHVLYSIAVFSSSGTIFGRKSYGFFDVVRTGRVRRWSTHAHARTDMHIHVNEGRKVREIGERKSKRARVGSERACIRNNVIYIPCGWRRCCQGWGISSFSKACRRPVACNTQKYSVSTSSCKNCGVISLPFHYNTICWWILMAATRKASTCVALPDSFSFQLHFFRAVP